LQEGASENYDFMEDMKMIEIKGCDSCRHTNICKNYDQRKEVFSEIADKLEALLDEVPEWAKVQMSSPNIRCEDYKYIPSEKHCEGCKLASPTMWGNRKKITCENRRGYFTKNASACEHFTT
jgi:hypothetical protein